VGEPDWPGARNLRDLGGRALRDGRVTTSGRVFRSGAPEYLTDEGWRQAKAAGLRTVIDLRNAPAETGRGPDHTAIGPESLSGLTFVPAPTEDPDETEFLRVCGPRLDHPPVLGRQRAAGPGADHGCHARHRQRGRRGARALRWRPGPDRHDLRDAARHGRSDRRRHRR